MTTIHYEGKLADPAKKEAFLDEIRMFAERMSFRITEIEEPTLSGVVLGGWKGMEPIPFIFDSEGVLHSFFEVLLHDAEFGTIVSVKTHYAGVQGHVGLCRLLRHVQTAYMPGLKVADESEFWQHQDEAALKAYFARLDRFADAFVDHLQNDVVVEPDGGVELMVRGIVQPDEGSRIKGTTGTEGPPSSNQPNAQTTRWRGNHRGSRFRRVSHGLLVQAKTNVAGKCE